jgi:tetratricopeptide (TPR) repeat protein
MIGSLLLERYRIDSELGQGGMGIVYQAFDILLKRSVAIKVLSDSGLSADSQSRLLDEARAAAGLSHPNIVTVYDVREYDGSLFIIMELVDGKSLKDESFEDLDRILEINRQLCEALAHAHQHNVIHRDLKPENVLLVDGQVKLMDFGLARSMASRMSTDGDLVGTAFYLAPEQALGMEVDERTDLYSLGVMMYEMLTGRLPFTAGDALAVISQHLHAPVIPPRTYNGKIDSELNLLILRLMNKTREERPSSADEVLSALSSIGKLEQAGVETGDIILLQQIVQGRLVGREVELDSLRRHWREAQQGHAQLVLISGEPGVGKTRLAKELIAYGRLHGGRILQGGCYEYEAMVPYLPFAEALRDWVHTQTTESLHDKLGSNATELAKLAPEIEARLGPLTPNPSLAPDQERMRLFDNFARFLQNLATEKGLLLFLDDLHWADRGTLSMVHYLLRRLRNERVLILGGYREVELDRTHPLAAALVEWNRERLVTRIQLGRLTKYDCGELLAGMFEQEEITPEFTEAIFRETEGNPFFIEEVVKALIDSGQIYRENLEWQRGDIADLAIPQSIKEAIGRRLNRLSTESTEVLQHAAILGKVFDFQELVTVYSNGGGGSQEQENSILDALDEGLNAQLIRALEGESFSFTHDKIRETLYEEINSIRRRRLHHKLAQRLEKVVMDQTRENYLPDLAYHYLQGGDLNKGMEYAIHAGEHARRLYANDEAIKYYLQAAEAADALQLTGELSEIFETVGELYSSQGMFYNAVEFYDQAISLVNTGEQRARLKMLIGISFANVGDARGLEYLRAAEQELHPETQIDDLSNTLSWIGRYYHYQAQHKQAIEAFENALKMAEPSDKYYIKSTLYAFLSGSYAQLLDSDQSVRWAQKCIALGEKYDAPTWIAVGNEFLSENAFFVGKWTEALEFANRDKEIGLKIGAQDRVAWAKFCQASSLYGLGMLNEALEVSQSSLDLTEQIGEHRLATWILPLLSMIHADLDAYEKAEFYAQEGIKQANELDQVVIQCWSRLAYINLLIKQNKWEEALHECEQGKQLYLPTDNLMARRYIKIITPLAHLGSGQLAEASAAVEEVIELVREHQVFHSHGMALRIKGQILTELGDHEKAAESYKEAIDILSGLGSQLELGRALYQRGRLLNMENQRDAAVKDIENARVIFEECGAKNDLRLTLSLTETL